MTASQPSSLGGCPSRRSLSLPTADDARKLGVWPHRECSRGKASLAASSVAAAATEPAHSPDAAARAAQPGSTGDGNKSRAGRLPEDSGANERSEAEASADENFKDEFEKLASLDEEWRDYMAQSASSNFDGRRGSKEADEKRQFLFDSIPVQETLQQNLIAQLNQTVLSADDRKAAELIIGNIDDDGFLQSTTEEMALNSEFHRTISKGSLD
jgi:DNA-directed RNA polymerase specialized sigma subunit, sigma54 homolog